MACNRVTTLKWEYHTNMTNETEKASTAADNEFLSFQSQIQKEILQMFPNWEEIKNDTIKREFKYLLIEGPGTMSMCDGAKMNKIKTWMESQYTTATICQYDNRKNCNIRYDPELGNIFRTEMDPDILAYYWTAHDKMSELIPPQKYEELISLQNTQAKGNGYKDMFQLWMVRYDDETPEYSANGFRKQMLEMWEEIRPIYEKIHAYVRMKLRGMPVVKRLFGGCGYIPIHLTRNMWAQDWSRLDELTKPFPDVASMDTTKSMRQQNYTVHKMFKIAENFFTDLGLPPMTPTFWNRSMLLHPKGRKVLCHPSAFDMCLGKGGEDYRIKMCTWVNHHQLVLLHHEMGHVAYFQQYKNLDIAFRDGANPGFHEALGDAIALSVVTPQHLRCKLGLNVGDIYSDICNGNNANASIYKREESISGTDINFLYSTALAKLVSIPFAISVDTWRWEVFEGRIKPEDYNKRWWEIRMENQGVAPPSNRSSPNLLDPAAIYHIVADVEYLRYFISIILQFQFYERMCIAAGEYDPKNKESKPLYQCDVSGSKEAGRLLGNMMKLGSSKPWPEALKTLTGSRKFSITPLKHYFQPLLDHIDKELEENEEAPGFGDKCK